MTHYSEEDIRNSNPWKDKNNYVNPNPTKLYDKNAERLLKCDAEMVNQFNEKNKGNDYKYELGLRPEPFCGNPLTAKVVILSLNPGFVPRVNNYFAKVLQSTEPKDIQEAVKKHKDEQLRLEAKSFLCQQNNNNDDFVSYRDALCMLDDWYWYDILNKFLTEVQGEGLLTDYTLDTIFDNVALVQYIGYMSKSYKAFPKGNILKSQEFTKKLIQYIAQNKKDVVFVISRSEEKWKKFIGDQIWENLKTNKRLVLRKKFTDKNNIERTIRTQHFGKNSFENEGFNLIINALK